MPLAAYELDRIPADEHRLVGRAQQGDRPAFAVLVERDWDRLYRWLYHLTHHRQTAEDLAQEAFLKAFAAVHTFRPGTNFRAWLFRIAYNAFVTWRRTECRSRALPLEPVPAEGPGPLEQVLSREVLQILAQAVSRLPAEFRAAFLLRVEEELSFREVAAVLRITEETARWRVFKARQKLMDKLGPYLGREAP